MALLALLVSSAAVSQPVDAVTEAAVVGAYLSSPSVTAELAAAAALARASGTAAPTLVNPELEGRHEEARGPAGASTDAIGASLTLDLGLTGVSERRAAGLRGEAGEARLRAEVVDAVCEVRSNALSAWAADERARALGEGQARIAGLVEQLDALARAGEGPAYDRDRVMLAEFTHRGTRDAAVAEAEGLRATLQSRTGLGPQAVSYLPLGRIGELESLVQQALGGDAELMALQLERDAARSSLAAQRRAAVPDLRLYGAARWDALPGGADRTPGFEVGGALELPLFDQNQWARRAAEAELAELEALVTRREAELRGEVEAAWARARALGSTVEPSYGVDLWEGARSRYSAGEASIDELLAVAADLEAVRVALAEGKERRRRAHLELACVVGHFPESEIQALVEEALR